AATSTGAAATGSYAKAAQAAPAGAISTTPRGRVSSVNTPASAKSVAMPSLYPAAPPQVPHATAAERSVAPTSVMDRDFIARNQIVERYLSGKLPIRGATDFERFCHAHPELLDEIGLPQRVHTGLRLLEASGKPEPWHEAKKPFWQKPALLL